MALLRQVFPSAAACCARTSKGGNEDERRHRDVSERTLTRSQAGHGTTQPRRGEVEINVYTHHFVAALDLSNAEDVLQQTSRSRSLLRRLGLTTTAALLHLCSYRIVITLSSIVCGMYRTLRYLSFFMPLFPGVEGIMRISEGIMRIRNELAVAFILHRTSCFQPTLCAF